MKRLLSLLTVLCLMIALMPVSASIYDPGSSTMYVKTSDGKKLNLRAEPDVNAQVLTKIPYGAQVLVYTDFVGMVWYHVQYGMYNGYVRTQFLTSHKPKPFVTPTPKSTKKPVVTPPPTPEEMVQQELSSARKLGLIPQGMTTEGNCTWQELDGLLTNLIRLKTKSSGAARNRVYLSRAQYEAANAGAPYNIVLRGVAAAEMYGALIDMGESDPGYNHSHDPFIADVADIEVCQQYAGIAAVPGSADWRALPMIDMVITILDHMDSASGKPVLSLDSAHDFFPTHPLTRQDAILAIYRLYNAFYHYLGKVTVTHQRQANLRAEPSMSAAIVGKVDPGDVFDVIAIPKKGWYQIQLPNGSTAFIVGGMVSYAMN